MTDRSIAKPPDTDAKPALAWRGFTSPATEAQATFRALMWAMAEPGTVHALPRPAGLCPGFSPAMTAIALALADFETAVWLEPLNSEAAAYLRFQTGAPVVGEKRSAAFAFLPLGTAWPVLADFGQGSLDYPDRSTTVIADVDAIDASHGWLLEGPGIFGARRFVAEPVPADLPLQLAINRAAFPLGIDLLLCAGSLVAALPRSTMLKVD